MIRGVNTKGEAASILVSPPAEISRTDTPPQSITFRQPQSADGPALHGLVAACPPLDPNSLYCNLLQCSHFAATGVVAERDGELVGFISGYIPPAQPDTLFVWQVAVASSARGQGLAKRMLRELLDRPATAAVRFLETTITPDNSASWALFESLARELGASHARQIHFERDRHFGGAHDDEMLMRIGPFAARSSADRQPVATGGGAAT